MIFIIDNYDSFVYNIIQTIPISENQIIIRRNDQFDISEIMSEKVTSIIISPGPMSPNQAGKSIEVIRKLKGIKPILGICLGHQCIGEAFGCNVGRNLPLHGRKSKINLSTSNLYEGLGSSIYAGRYHSLYIFEEGFNHNELRINATLDNGLIMGVEHKSFPIYGVQFHPESILSEPYGRIILQNFLKISGLI